MAQPDINLRTGMMNSVTALMGKLAAEQYAKVYYVNNIDGSDTLNNGLSKTKPFAQISKAITAWEAFRLAQSNVNCRGLIYVYGTITAYTAELLRHRGPGGGSTRQWQRHCEDHGGRCR
jgi:hypothetical protein